MQHKPFVMGANATGDRSSSAQILRSLRGKGHNARQCLQLKRSFWGHLNARNGRRVFCHGLRAPQHDISAARQKRRPLQS